jgi:hypothetical protein
VIRAFGILNETIPPDNPAYGVPLPVTYWLDSNGVVKRKYAEDDYRERISSASILVREFKDGAVAGQEIQAKHLTLRTSASNSSIYVGGPRDAHFGACSAPEDACLRAGRARLQAD